MNRLAIVAVIGALGGSARAESVGVATSDSQLALGVAAWLASHGKTVVAAALPAEMTSTLHDCFVLEDPGCARSVVEKHAKADAIVYIDIDRKSKDIAIITHWIVKGQAPTSRRGTCAGCSDAMVADHVLKDLAQLAQLAAPVAAPPSQPSITIPAPPPPTSRGRRGLAVGAEVGEPSSATAAWFTNKLAITAGLGTGTFQGAGLALRAAALYEVAELVPHVPLRVGVGGRLYHHGYESMSIDELSHTHYGLYASASIAIERGPIQVYAELAPGVDVSRSRSCTLARGPDTVCPHSQAAPVFVHFLVGARWFLTR